VSAKSTQYFNPWNVDRCDNPLSVNDGSVMLLTLVEVAHDAAIE
jgi:hypothetical protein